MTERKSTFEIDKNDIIIEEWIIQMNNLIFAIPPDYTFCQTHFMASSVGKNINPEPKNQFLCGCCKQPVINEPFSLWCDIFEFDKFGLGYSLYFSLIKLTIVNCILGNVFYIIFAIVGYILIPTDPPKQFTFIQFGNFLEHYPTLNCSYYFTYQIIAFLTITWSLFSVKKHLTKLEIKKTRGIKYRSLLLKKIPKDWNDFKIKSLFPMNSIEKIIWVPDLSLYTKLHKKFMRMSNSKIYLLLKSQIFQKMKIENKCCILSKIDKSLQNENYFSVGSSHLKESLLATSNKLDEIIKKTNEIKCRYFLFPQECSINSAFIQFTSESEARNAKNLSKHLAKKFKVQILAAPPPSDVIWENLNLNASRNIIVLVINYVFIILLALCSFPIIYFSVCYFKNIPAAGCLFALLLITVNWGIELGSFIDFGVPSSSKNQKNMFFTKYCVGSFINLLIIPTSYWIDMLLDGEQSNDQNEFHYNGIQYTLILLLIYTTLISHLRDFTSISNLKKMYLRMRIHKGNINTILQPQILINKYYEKFDFNLPFRYIFIVMGYCFIVILQFGYYLSFYFGTIFLFAAYWIDKIIFTKFSRTPQRIGFNYFKKSIQMYLIATGLIIWLKYFLIYQHMKQKGLNTRFNNILLVIIILISFILTIVLISVTSKLIQKRSVKRGQQQERAKSVIEESLILKDDTPGYDDYNPLNSVDCFLDYNNKSMKNDSKYLEQFYDTFKNDQEKEITGKKKKNLFNHFEEPKLFFQ